MSSAKAKVVGAGLASAVAIAMLVWLGTWQLQRLAWKNEVVAQVAARSEAPPVPPPPSAEWRTLGLGSWSYRRVRAAGVFDHSREARVYTALGEPKGRYGGPGYFILTPLTLREGGVVLVNRGFVPMDRADPATRRDGERDGEVEVTGLLREPEPRNAFTPADDPAKRLFFVRDPGPIAEALGVAPAAPFTIDADAGLNPGGLPQGGETRLAFPNRHLEYALTWYGLAGALLAVFMAFAWRTIRDERAA
jgi:surfeit locus 1 family protein